MRSLPANFPTAFIVNRVEEQHPSMLDVFPGIKHSSAIFLRLEVHGGLAGVLVISTMGHNRYFPEHTRLLNTIREPFAIAMTNARRYREPVHIVEIKR